MIRAEFFAIERKYPYSFSFSLFFFSLSFFPSLFFSSPRPSSPSPPSPSVPPPPPLLTPALPSSAALSPPPHIPHLLCWLASSFPFVLAFERLALLPFLALLASFASSSPSSFLSPFPSSKPSSSSSGGGFLTSGLRRQLKTIVAIGLMLGMILDSSPTASSFPTRSASRVRTSSSPSRTTLWRGR
uniref:Uncharacterized protein n=1 Tax=Ananas comosus var. bracteatus TaxID=296719 RepID=A0A6V7NEW3_ANACO|nr:unnamed protein product [Ananas comosus var. bracteatus]